MVVQCGCLNRETFASDSATLRSAHQDVIATLKSQLAAEKARADKLQEQLNWSVAIQNAALERQDALALENAKLRKVAEAAQFAECTISHALHLGYLGEGSTNGMAMDAQERLEKALADLDATPKEGHMTPKEGQIEKKFSEEGDL